MNCAPMFSGKTDKWFNSKCSSYKNDTFNHWLYAFIGDM